MAGGKDNAKLPHEAKGTAEVSRGQVAVAEVSEEVDNLSELVMAVETAISTGDQVSEKDIVYVTEMLMRQLLILDGIEAEGEARMLRKTETHRVQSLVDTMDNLKAKNTNQQGSSSSNSVNETTQQETFGCGAERIALQAESNESTADYLDLRAKQKVKLRPTNIPASQSQLTVTSTDALDSESSSPSTLKPSSSSQGSLMQRVSSLLASLSQSQSHLTSSPQSIESDEESGFTTAFQAYKTMLAKNFEEVISEDNAQRMQTILHVLCSQPRKLPTQMVNPIRDLTYRFPNMVEKWNQSHERLATHLESKGKLEEANKILEEYATERKTWEQQLEALTNAEEILEKRLTDLRCRKEKILSMQQKTSSKIDELVNLVDVQSTSLTEIQEAIDSEEDTIAYTLSTWKQFQSTVN